MKTASIQRRTEQTLAVMLFLLLVAPLILTGLRTMPGRHARLSRWLDHWWIGRPKLVGVTKVPPNVPPSWGSIRHREFQASFAHKFNDGFAGREALIRCTSELWFQLFHDTANVSSNVAIGERDVLFEKGYLEEYFFGRVNKSELEPWVKDLRRLQDYCRSIGLGFAVMLTPGKASIYPEDAPHRWKERWYDPHPRTHILLTELFRENGIFFVDAVDLVAKEKLKGPPAPLFAKGGLHWNTRAALVAANAVMARFAEQGKPAEQIQVLSSRVTDQPDGDEADLANVMNLARPWKYPCEVIQIKPSDRSKSDQMTMAMIGDSFGFGPLHLFKESGQFSDIGFFFYYTLSKANDAYVPAIREPTAPMDFNREIFAADCLLLEISETTALSPIHFLSGFIIDALTHRPDPKAPRPPFRAD